MSLFVDSDHITTAALALIDPEVPTIASKAGITLEGDTGVIRSAWSECANRISNMVQNYSGALDRTTFTNLFAVSGNRPKLRLDHFVVSSSYGQANSPMYEWITSVALARFYRSAIFRTANNDRLESKLNLADDEEARRWKELRTFGFPVVLLPLPAPAALHVVGSGQWSISAVSGGTSTPSSWVVAITWVDESSYVSRALQGNGESGPSQRRAVALSSNQQIRVDIADLVPPGAASLQVGLADGTPVTRTATGWNVYAAPPGEQLRLQNALPISVGTVSYEFTPTTSGVEMGDGQHSDTNFTVQNTWAGG